LPKKDYPSSSYLRRHGKFEWTTKANEALKRLKIFLTSPPILTSPGEKDTLLICITTTTNVVSMTIIVERVRRKAMYTRYRGQSTSSVRFY
jgi:hypothetical protein